MNITIRNEQPSDYNAILRLTYEAFQTLDYPGRMRMDEHFLISLLKDSLTVIKELCFIAELDGKIVGHILYTKSGVTRPDCTKTETITFGPLSVLPKHQRMGVGKALVMHSMEKAREMGYGAVLITGVPEYYPKLGFKRASEYSIRLENDYTDLHAVETMDAVFMAYELIPDYLNVGGIFSEWSSEFDIAENDDKGYAQFHKQFMTEHYPDTLVLRTFFENDISLMERWLYVPHVAKWYQHPDHWLRELHERHGEFSFITHFIVEINGEAIGFCQYYDCHYAQEHEVWHDEGDCNISERKGEVFSLDYLIGETQYLCKGYGKEIVRLLTEKVRSISTAKEIIVQPEVDNLPSQKVLTANGYVFDEKLKLFIQRL